MPSLTKVRRTGSNPVTKAGPSWASWPNWRERSGTGATVTDETALSLTTFYRGVQMIASSIAGLPLHIYHKNEKGVRERIETPDTAYLWDRPNEEQTRVTFWERVIGDEVRGNAFIWVEKDGSGLPAALWWIDRNRVRVGRNSEGVKVYQLDNELPMIDYKAGGEIVHIPNWGGSLVGYDIVKLASQAIALGLSAEEYAAQTFANGGIPPGILSTEMELTPAESETLSEIWHAARTKAPTKAAVLGKGAKFQATGADPEKMQMEALRKFQASEILTLLGLPEGATTWHAIAEQGQAFVRYCLDAHTSRIKAAIDDDLLVHSLTGRYVFFDPGGFLRGNLLQQYQAHVMGWGRFLTTNEIRADLNLPPVEGGDILLKPVNMAPATDEEATKMARSDGPPAEQAKR